MPNPTKPDGRVNNKRPPKYGELKKSVKLALTPTAWQWLKSQGSADWIEKQARAES